VLNLGAGFWTESVRITDEEVCTCCVPVPIFFSFLPLVFFLRVLARLNGWNLGAFVTGPIFVSNLNDIY